MEFRDECQQLWITQARDLHQNVHQRGAFTLLLRCGHATAIIISHYLTVINRLSVNTYKEDIRFRKPMLYPAELRAL